MLLAQIDIYTHFFKLTKVHNWLIPVVKQVADELTQTQYFKIYGKVQKRATKVYATCTRDYSEFRFHINYLPRFKEHLRNHRMNFDNKEAFNVITHDVYEPREATLKMPEDVNLHDYQQTTVEYCLEDGVSKLITLPTGSGKEGPVDSLVKIPNGWKRLGDLMIGDVISTPSGTTTKINGIYDQGVKESIKTTFVDGREAVTGLGHNWLVWVVSDRKWYVKTTSEIYQRFLRYRQLPTGISRHDSRDEVNVRMAIPLVNPIMSPDREVILPLDPYLLGVILGDGSITRTGRTSISKPDDYLFTECERILRDYNCSTYRLMIRDKCPALIITRNGDSVNEVGDILIRYGLNGKRSWEKFIPDIYLHASFDQRLRLIQGLMDTDGSVGINTKGIEYTTTSEVLSKQMVYLLRSVGCIASVTSRVTKYTYDNEVRNGRVSYRLSIRAQIPSMLFNTPVKKDKCKDVNQYTRKGLKLRITDMVPVGKVESRCISVEDSESLYITNDYVVTHNTFTALKLTEYIGGKLLIIVLGRYMEKWTSDVRGAYGDDCDLAIIKGGADFNKLLLNAEATGNSPDVTLVSTTTVQNYIKNWEHADFYERKNMIDPTRICELLGVGVRMIDEAHQHFHANFKMDLYLHCPKALYLTATLESQDAFLSRMYKLMWPDEMRTEQMKPPAYDHTFALHYTHLYPEKVRCMGSQGYSHTTYEQSIWRHVPSRVEYLDMIGNVVETGFLPFYKPGRKMLIFCSLIETCQEVAEYLSARFKDQNWQISKYTSGDPKTLIDTNDITVSTLGKAGTALDVYGLITCLMTVALSEPKANIQAKGRLRNIQVKPEFADVVPRFYYFVADDLEKPYYYYTQKKLLFSERTLLHKDEYTGVKIGEPIKEAYPLGLPDYHKDVRK